MGWDGVGWDGTGRDEMDWDGVGLSGVGWDVMAVTRRGRRGDACVVDRLRAHGGHSAGAL